MRLFVALELVGAARDELAAWSARTLPAGLRLVPASDLHVTLCFLGERPPSDAAPIAGAVATAIAGTAPIELTLGATLWLPARRPRVLAVCATPTGPVPGRDGDPGALDVLQSRVAAALAAGGFVVPERRRFLAHITVARVRGRGRPGGSDPPPPAAVAGPAGLRGRAAEVSLICSRPGVGPARYERLNTIALAGCG